MTRRPARSGLSLLEVLLALAILLLSMVAIGRLVDIGTDMSMDARMNTRGARLAQAKMAEVEAGVIALSNGTASGTFDDDPSWNWTVEPVSQGAPNLFTVTVKVSRDLNGRPFEVTLTQILYDPSKLGSAAQAEKTTDSSTTGGTTGTTSSGGTSP